MTQLLVDNPLLLLFIIVAIGYPLGQIRFGQSQLGVAAILFVGIALGSLGPDVQLPEIIYLFGLLLFVYTIGLSSAPGFFASFRRRGLRNNLLVVGMLLLAFAGTLATARVLSLCPTLAAGLFAGSLTNTPALAAVLETVKELAPASARDQWLAEPVVGYAMAGKSSLAGHSMTAVSASLRRRRVCHRET